MYYSWLYITLVFLIALIPFSIPIKLKNRGLRSIRNGLIIGFIISTFITLTPENAVNGAPLHKFGKGKIAFFSCSYQIALTKASFCDGDSPYLAGCYCNNVNARATIAHCYATAHSEAIPSFLDLCATDFNTPLTHQEFDQSLTNYSKYAKSLDDLNGVQEGQTVDFPVRLDDDMSFLFKASYDQFLGNYDRSVLYGGYLVLYWMVVFALVSAANWSKIVFPSIHKKLLIGPFSNWFRQSISLPATKGKYKTNEKPFLKVLDFLAPTRLESIILTGFCLLAGFLSVHKIHYIEGDPVFRDKYHALLRFYAVRTSILTSSMMPLLILFGGRNNFFQWITRWDYATFITLHRWISRILVVMIIIHSVFYSVYALDFSKLVREEYILWGILGTGSGVFILIQGLLVLRRRWYEVFLALHIVLAFAFIFGAYMHVLDLYCLWFYHFTLAVWAFDRIVRIGRLISFGFPKAKVVLLADEAIKVIVPKPQHWETIPGGHCFIHFLQPSCFWQSHPFTYTTSLQSNGDIILFCKVKQGVTERLYHYLKTHPGRTTEIRVAIEGSYGEQTPASRHNLAVFVAGGNGIPGIFAEAFDLWLRNPNITIQLIWVVREYKSLYWFYEELYWLKRTNIETTIYVTQPDRNSCFEEFELRFPINEDCNFETSTLLKNSVADYGTLKSVEANDITSSSNGNQVQDIISTIKQELSHIKFKHGRPSMDLVVKDAIKLSHGSAAFIPCGHPIMVDDLRQAVVNNIGNDEHKRVDYYEQLQVWA